MTAPVFEIDQFLGQGGLAYGIVQPGALHPGGVPMLRVTDLDQSAQADDVMQVSPSIEEKFARTRLVGGELLLSVVGRPGLARVAPPGYAGYNVARAIAVLRPTGVESEWLALAFETPSVRHQVAGLLNTTVQATLNLADIRRIQVPLPAIERRRAILDVVSALDDKIAANRRVIDRGLRLIDAFYEGTPKHRDKSTFDDVAVLGGGGTPSTKDGSLWGGEHAWATPSDVTRLDGPWLAHTERTVSHEGLRTITSPMYPRRTILMTSRASIGHCALAAGPTAINQGFIAIRAHSDAMQNWLFAQVRQRTSEFLSWANGATFLELPRGIFKTLAVELAAEDVLARFHDLAEPLLLRVEAAQMESARLAATRDELLPLLMDGRITVRDAEKRVEGEV